MALRLPSLNTMLNLHKVARCIPCEDLSNSRLTVTTNRILRMTLARRWYSTWPQHGHMALSLTWGDVTSRAFRNLAGTSHPKDGRGSFIPLALRSLGPCRYRLWYALRRVVSTPETVDGFGVIERPYQPRSATLRRAESPRAYAGAPCEYIYSSSAS